MGLAPYGNPTYVDLIKEHLIDIKEDGSFKLNMEYFNYTSGLTMTSQKFHDLLQMLFENVFLKLAISNFFYKKKYANTVTRNTTWYRNNNHSTSHSNFITE